MLLDSDVMVEVLRLHPPALTWLAGLGGASVGLPGLVAMELLQGCRNLHEQRNLDSRIRQFVLHWPSKHDCQRALADFATFRLSHGLGLLDALIAHTAVGAGEPLATFNVKHFSVVASLTVVAPY